APAARAGHAAPGWFLPWARRPVEATGPPVAADGRRRRCCLRSRGVAVRAPRGGLPVAADLDGCDERAQVVPEPGPEPARHVPRAVAPPRELALTYSIGSERVPRGR